eukprot:g4583.t1
MRTASGAAGLSLTEARFGILLEPSTNVALERQAIGRLHRIGQTAPVEVFRPVVRDTVEEALIERRGAAGKQQEGQLTNQELVDLFGVRSSMAAPSGNGSGGHVGKGEGGSGDGGGGGDGAAS